MNKIIHGDSTEVLKKGTANSIDLIATDPPYGYSFMGKDWDKAVPSVDIWKECLRVLKPGAFAFVMSAPRQDVLSQMIVRLGQAGFDTSFTSLYWTYASGFPKAMNIGKMVDKRMGVEREVTGVKMTPSGQEYPRGYEVRDTPVPFERSNGLETAPASPQAVALDGSYGGFQPKPAVEVIIVAMKPLSEKTYVDQALKNGKGITWLDDCRMPTNPDVDDKRLGGEGSWDTSKAAEEIYEGGYAGERISSDKRGRFPANLLVSDDVLNDGKVSKSSDRTRNNKVPTGEHGIYGHYEAQESHGHADSGSYSRFFSLDAWGNEKAGNHPASSNPVEATHESVGAESSLARQAINPDGHSCAEETISDLPDSVKKTLPFLIVPKASKREKNAGLEGFEEKFAPTMGNGTDAVPHDPETAAGKKNTHATVKPLTLMSYLITLGSREGDIVLDPFLGSGTTACAAKQLKRGYVGIEREEEYVKIAEARVNAIEGEQITATTFTAPKEAPQTPETITESPEQKKRRLIDKELNGRKLTKEEITFLKT